MTGTESCRAHTGDFALQTGPPTAKHLLARGVVRPGAGSWLLRHAARAVLNSLTARFAPRISMATHRGGEDE